jgi:hypothetical protein
MHGYEPTREAAMTAFAKSRAAGPGMLTRRCKRDLKSDRAADHPRGLRTMMIDMGTPERNCGKR